MVVYLLWHLAGQVLELQAEQQAEQLAGQQVVAVVQQVVAVEQLAGQQVVAGEQAEHVRLLALAAVTVLGADLMDDLLVVVVTEVVEEQEVELVVMVEEQVELEVVVE